MTLTIPRYRLTGARFGENIDPPGMRKTQGLPIIKGRFRGGYSTPPFGLAQGRPNLPLVRGGTLHTPSKILRRCALQNNMTTLLGAPFLATSKLQGLMGDHKPKGAG